MDNLTQEQIEKRQWNANEMGNLAQPEIEEIAKAMLEINADGYFCLLLTQYMMGYLRMAPTSGIEEKIDDTRQVFFKQIKRHLDEKTTTT